MEIELWFQKEYKKHCLEIPRSVQCLWKEKRWRKNMARAHSDVTLEGRFLISFVALTILTDFHRRMKQKTTRIVKGKAIVDRPIGDEMTLKEIRNYLSSIRLINDGRGNRIWQEVTVRQHNIARRLGFPDLYRELPDWGPR